MSALVGAREVPATRLADVMSRAGLSVVEATRVEDHLVGSGPIHQRVPLFGEVQ